jgi:hypothetical protein
MENERFLLTFSRVMIGPSWSRSCPAVLYKLDTSSTICNACTCSFGRLFVTVKNKGLVNPTPNSTRIIIADLVSVWACHCPRSHPTTVAATTI